MENPICKDKVCSRSRACDYYSPVNQSKTGLCKKPMKLTFLCHYSEKVLDLYNEDSKIITNEDLK